jgi:hypothetical protein
MKNSRIHRGVSIAIANGCFKCFESYCQNQDANGSFRVYLSLNCVPILNKDYFLLKFD